MKMMREVTCDEGNGESTFEFVESKIEGLNLNEETFKPNSSGTSESKLGNQEDINTQVIPTATTSTLSSNNGIHSPHASTETTSSFPSPLSSTIPPLIQTVQPSANVLFQSSPSQFQQSSQFYANNSLMSPIEGYSFANQGGSDNSSIVQSQPSTMHSMPQSSAMAIELPISDQHQSHVHFSPNSGAENRAGFFSWIKDTVSGSEFLNKVAEKAKNSMDSMITTLDPQMKEYIYSGGDISVFVASDMENKISGVREAFQNVFGRASIMGILSQANIASQPVGFAAGLKGAEERINYLRQGNQINQLHPVLAIENFLVELTSERWYDVGCLVLYDPSRQLTFHSYTQAIPVPIQAVQQAQDETPPDYPLRWSGLAIPIGKIISHIYQIPQAEWHERLGGVSQRDMIYQAAKVIATNYKQNLETAMRG